MGLRRHPRATTYAVSLALHLALAPFLVHDWDGYVFVTATQDFLGGVSPYEKAEAAPPSIYAGDAVPVVNSWYAYPPVPLLLFAPFVAFLTGLSAEPAAARLAIKLPLILGNLLLAWLSWLLVRDVLRDRADPRAEERAAWAERAILLNPLLVLIAAAWGMFDAWILVFLVAGVLLWRSGSSFLAGASFGLAALVKLFPLFLAPAFAAYALRSRGLRPTGAAVGGAAAAAALLCLPFWWEAPAGFVQQTVGIHLARAPQGFALVGLPLAFPWLNGLFGMPLLPETFAAAHVTAASGVLSLVLLGLLYSRVDRVRTEADAVALSLLAILAVLLAGKVVNEQYLVLPVGLATLAFALGADPRHRALLRTMSIGGAIAATLSGWHFLTFIPPDVWARLGTDATEAIEGIQRTLAASDLALLVFPTVLSVLALVPALAASLRLLLPELLLRVREALAALRVSPAPSRPLAAAMLATLLLAPAILAVAATPPAGPDGPALPVGPRFVAARYDTSWRNPGHDPSQALGPWRATTGVPADGFYTVTAGKLDRDFATLRAAGVDVALVDTRFGADGTLAAISRISVERGVLVAPVLDLADFARDPARRALAADGTRTDGLALRGHVGDDLAHRTGQLLRALGDSSSMWRLDGRPVLVLESDPFAPLDASAEFRAELLAAATALLVGHGAALAPGVDASALESFYPKSAEDLASAHPTAALWRAARADVEARFWERFRSLVEGQHGPVFLVRGEAWDLDPPGGGGYAEGLRAAAVFDASLASPPGDAWTAASDVPSAWGRWTAGLVRQAMHDRAAGRPVILPVFPGYDDRIEARAEGVLVPPDLANSTYDRSWSDVLALAPDVVVVHSWNGFDAGTAIEPTKEDGRALLDRTTLWAQRFKTSPAPAPPRVLVVANHLGAALAPGARPPDSTYALSASLLLAAQAAWGASAASAEWNGPLGAPDLARYSLVVVEPGPGVAFTADAAAFVEALRAHVRGGGRVLLLGGELGEFERLASHADRGPLAGPVALETPLPNATLRAGVPARLAEPAAGATVVAWMKNATTRAPAAWLEPDAGGRLLVTAFRPQGLDRPTVAEGAALRALSEILLPTGATP